MRLSIFSQADSVPSVLSHLYQPNMSLPISLATHTIKSSLNCKSEKAIYLWRCIKCVHNTNTTTLPDINNMQGTTYCGMRRFALRMAEHRNYAKSNNVAESSGEHFNLASIISRVWQCNKQNSRTKTNSSAGGPYGHLHC